MLLYLSYNADLLEVPTGHDKMGLGYVDDMVLMSTAKDFGKAHQRLKQMMVWAGSAVEWSGTHNSPFETTKSVLVDFTRSKTVVHPSMMLSGVTLLPQPTHRFLGVQVDHELQWNHQASSTLVKASKWVLAFRHLAQPSTGVHPSLIRQLYNLVA